MQHLGTLVLIGTLHQVVMKHLESGKDKIQKICDSIRKETLEPAKQEAREIVENAHLQAAEIVREAGDKAKTMQRECTAQIEEKKRLLRIVPPNCRADRRSKCSKQKIEQGLFQRELGALVDQQMSRPEVIAELIQSFMRSLEERGIEEDFEALIPKDISPRTINALLAKKVLERLKHQTVTQTDIHGGVQIRMAGRQVTIDISDAVVREMLASYIRRDFRDLIFQG